MYEMTQTKLEELQNQFRKLSPKERNDRLQALFAAKLEDLSSKGNLELEITIELFKALAKSFDLSIKFDAVAGETDHDAF